ncbi:MAG: hypothetical protein IPJ65_23235 [Archangiaceae bacterium]|nr:hypothetical protein [Archangiaceae bacterium]
MKLFLPQKTLEEWSTTEKADLQDGKLVVAEGKATHGVTPAVHFVKLVSGVDQSQLVGRVKTMAQLDTLGCEHMMDSVILGEAAYEVTPGYVADVAPPAAAATPGKPGDKKKATSPEADLLAAFILDKL